MSFAAFILKLEADAKGVEKGVNTAQQHFRRLGSTVKDIEGRSKAQTKELEKQTKAAFERLKPEEKLVSLMRTKEQLANRLARVDDPRLKNAYLQKQLELEKQIANAKAQGAANAASDKRRGLIGTAASILLPGAAAGAAVKFGASSAGEIEDLSLKTGFSTGTIERLQAASGAKGGNFSQLLQVLIDVQKNRSSALLGDEGAMKHFNRLGISKDQLGKMSAEDTAFKLFDMVQNGEINSGNMAAFFGIAEQGAKEILPELKRGLDDAANGFAGLGKTASGTIASLAAVRNAVVGVWGGLKATGAGAGRKLGAGFLSVGKLGAAAALNLVGAHGMRDDLLLSREQMWEDNPDLGLEDKLSTAQFRRDAQDFEDEWLSSGDLVTKGASATKAAQRNRNRMGGTSHIDTDPMAQIGLYIGGQAQRYQQEQIRELQAIKRELQDIKQEMDE